MRSKTTPTEPTGLRRVWRRTACLFRGHRLRVLSFDLSAFKANLAKRKLVTFDMELPNDMVRIFYGKCSHCGTVVGVTEEDVDAGPDAEDGPGFTGYEQRSSRPANFDENAETVGAVDGISVHMGTTNLALTEQAVAYARVQSEERLHRRGVQRQVTYDPSLAADEGARRIDAQVDRAIGLPDPIVMAVVLGSMDVETPRHHHHASSDDGGSSSSSSFSSSDSGGSSDGGGGGGDSGGGGGD
jgi:uncharacterized membrane protein YgcG